jgi:two-component system, NtrC family, response regulator
VLKDSILIVGEGGQVQRIKAGLSDTYIIHMAKDPLQGYQFLKDQIPLVIILYVSNRTDSPEDRWRLMKSMTEMAGPIKVIIITENDDRTDAIMAIEAGAFDYHTALVDMDALRVIVGRAAYLSKIEREYYAEYNLSAIEHGLIDGMVAINPHIVNVMNLAAKVAKTNYPVLLQGESGTGKGCLARLIHRLSQRKSRPFVIVDCGSIPHDLLESELFGHEKGSFTGAYARQIGKLERASAGTVVLDEVSCLPLLLQVKMLRFLQERTVERIGGNHEIPVDARVIAISNTDLESLVKNGVFREDLFYRLNVIPLKVPPLRERPEDIVALARVYLGMYCREIDRGFKGYTEDAMDAMMTYGWPGNIREMQNRIRRAMIMAKADYLTPEDLGLTSPVVDGLPSLQKAREDAETRVIRMALSRNNNNISKAAKLLKISRPTLYDLMKKHQILVNGQIPG